MTQSPPRPDSATTRSDDDAPDTDAAGISAPDTDEGPDPSAPPRRRRGRRDNGDLTPIASLLRWVGGLLSVMIFLVTVAGFGFYRYFDQRINRVALHLGTHRPAPAPPGDVNYLLVGTDSRAGTDGEYGSAAGQRSDTTILAHLDQNGTTTMVSFPRDMWVDIPGHGMGKINTAISTGGPSLLVSTIEQLTDITIDHYVSVDLAGFKAMTNAIGSVTVCVAPLPAARRDAGFNNLADHYSGWSGHVGLNRLDGDQALSFVRQRHGLPGGDLDRIRRQQQFIGAVFRKATGTGVLTNPSRLEGLLATVTSAVTVDNGTNLSDLRRLATRLRGLDASKIQFMTVPTYIPTPADGANDLGEIQVGGQRMAVEL
ncbi:MAG: LCP family protein [Frankia sp.]